MYISDFYNSGQAKKSNNSNSHTHTKVNNHQRRYNLLEKTLDGYKREYQNYINIEKGTGVSKKDDKQIVKNQIDNIKDKMTKMKEKYNF